MAVRSVIGEGFAIATTVVSSIACAGAQQPATSSGWISTLHPIRYELLDPARGRYLMGERKEVRAWTARRHYCEQRRRNLAYHEVVITTYGNLWSTPADRVLRLEITNLDSPYIAPSRVPSATVISEVRLELPVR